MKKLDYRTTVLISGQHLNMIQGAFLTVLKRKTLFNQHGSFVHQEFHRTESLIGCRSFFISVLKIGRNS